MQSRLTRLWNRWRQRPPTQPRLLILGAQKAGTTTLFDMLDGVGAFRGSSTKEIGFFSKDVFYERGMPWYLGHFGAADEDHIGFEATPEYLYYDFVAPRIRQWLPQARFVVLLREPAARCFSAWNMFRSFNRDQPQTIYDHFTQWSNADAREPLKQLLFTRPFPDFAACVESELSQLNGQAFGPEPSFVRRGLYAAQIERYLSLFGRDRFLFLEQNELNDPARVARGVGELMGTEIDPLALKVQSSNQGEYGATDEELARCMERLRAFYRPHNERLFRLIGRSFDW